MSLCLPDCRIRKNIKDEGQVVVLNASGTGLHDSVNKELEKLLGSQFKSLHMGAKYYLNDIVPSQSRYKNNLERVIKLSTAARDLAANGQISVIGWNDPWNTYGTAARAVLDGSRPLTTSVLLYHPIKKLENKQPDSWYQNLVQYGVLMKGKKVSTPNTVETLTRNDLQSVLGKGKSASVPSTDSSAMSSIVHRFMTPVLGLSEFGTVYLEPRVTYDMVFDTSKYSPKSIASEIVARLKHNLTLRNTSALFHHNNNVVSPYTHVACPHCRKGWQSHVVDPNQRLKSDMPPCMECLNGTAHLLLGGVNALQFGTNMHEELTGSSFDTTPPAQAPQTTAAPASPTTTTSTTTTGTAPPAANSTTPAAGASTTAATGPAAAGTTAGTGTAPSGTAATTHPAGNTSTTTAATTAASSTTHPAGTATAPAATGSTASSTTHPAGSTATAPAATGSTATAPAATGSTASSTTHPAGSTATAPAATGAAGSTATTPATASSTTHPAGSTATAPAATGSTATAPAATGSTASSTTHPAGSAPAATGAAGTATTPATTATSTTHPAGSTAPAATGAAGSTATTPATTATSTTHPAGSTATAPAATGAAGSTATTPATATSTTHPEGSTAPAATGSAASSTTHPAGSTATTPAATGAAGSTATAPAAAGSTATAPATTSSSATHPAGSTATTPAATGSTASSTTHPAGSTATTPAATGAATTPPAAGTTATTPAGTTTTTSGTATTPPAGTTTTGGPAAAAGAGGAAGALVDQPPPPLTAPETLHPEFPEVNSAKWREQYKEYYFVTSQSAENSAWTIVSFTPPANCCTLRGGSQDFDATKKSIKTSPFVDDTEYFFPYPNMHVISPEQVPIWRGVTPSLVKGDTSPEEVTCGGSEGIIWLLQAMCAVASQKAIEKMFINRDDKLGIYEVQYYTWSETQKNFTIPVKVLIDNRIPMIDGDSIPAYTYSEDKAELWPSLVEKGFAKTTLYRGKDLGGYKGMKKGNVSFGVCQLLGGQAWKMQPAVGKNGKRAELNPTAVAQDIMNLFSTGHFIHCRFMDHAGANFTADGSVKYGNKGLLSGCTYAIMSYRKVPTEKKVFHLLELRSPWKWERLPDTLKKLFGSEKAFAEKAEWTGDWSKTSPLWETYPEAKIICNFKKAGEGLFWISVDDFLAELKSMDVAKPMIKSPNGGSRNFLIAGVASAIAAVGGIFAWFGL